MTTRRSKPAPRGLDDAGKVLWRNLTREFEFNSAELALLHELCCTRDEVAQLKAALIATSPVVEGSRGQLRANPLLAELRNHRKLADQLVVALAVDTRWRKRKSGGRTQAVKKLQGGAA